MQQSLGYRVLRSLLRDLLIPWVISAICIALFIVVVYAFGLVAWPVCCLFFLFVCVARSESRKQLQEQSNPTQSVTSPPQ